MKNRYLIRSVKYLLWLVFLLVAVMVFMTLTGTSRWSAEENFAVMFGSRRGLLMLAVIVVLALLYPRFGFTERVVNAGLAEDREKILKAFVENGYRLEDEQADRLVFRATTGLKKGFLMWEDAITVTAESDHYIRLEGIRKEVVKVEYRLKSYLL